MVSNGEGIMADKTVRGPIPTNTPKLLLYADSADSTVPLVQLVRSVQQDDPLAPVTVIGPSTYANLTLRRRLARSGFANVRFLPFSRLSEFLGSPSLAAQGRKPFTPIIESASVRAVLGRSNGILSGLRSHPSTVQSVRNTFRQFRHASETALERLANQDSLRGEVVALYRDFREQTNVYYDAEDLARAAAQAVGKGKSTALEDLGAILFYQVCGMTPGETHLVNALARLDSCAVFLVLTGDAEADGLVESCAQDLAPFLGQPQRSESRDGMPPRALSPIGKRMVITPGPHEEVRWVVRQIVHQAEQGTPFHRMAILYGAPTPYNTLVREELLLASIPLSGPNPTPLGRTAAGRTLTGLLQLSASEFPRDRVMAWLMACPVRPPQAGLLESFNPSSWDAISKRAGIVAGLEQWKERLDRYAYETERHSRSREEKGEVSQAKASLMVAEARSARALLRFVETLAEDLAPPPDGSPWSLFAQWGLGLLQRYFSPSDQMTALEQDAFNRTVDILEGLASADAVDPTPTLDAFVESLEEALQSSVGHSGETGQGVFVGPMAAALGMEFDVVHIVGLIEGAAPAPARDDPLVPDRDRREAGGAQEGLPSRQTRLAEERRSFLSALGSAPEATLSFPRSDPAGQRAHYPSRWFLEQASVLEGKQVHTSALWKLADRPWLTAISSMDRALESVAAAAPADQHDYDLEHLWTWKRSGRETTDHPLATSGLLARSMRLSRSRYRSSDFTEWDGNLSGSMQNAGLAARISDTALSPTSLERWAACPFSYFLGQRLRISALEDPEEISSITPMEKGSLVHKVLETFITEAAEEGTLPGPSEPWTSLHRQQLTRIAEHNFREAEAQGVTGKPLMWQLAQEDILNDLYSFLEEDHRVRARFGLSPAYLEARFGLDGDSWPAPELWLDGPASIKFRGVIDRIDSGPEGKEILVMDYKSGGPRPYSGLEADPIDKGRHLQLAVYSLAARKALGDDAIVRAAYWFVSSRGGFSLVPAIPLEIASEETLERFKEGVSVIVSGIRSGAFPANPGRWDYQDFHNCRFCDFKPLCPPRKDTLWERKRGHPLLSNYLQLAGDTVSGETES